ncbi:MAG: VCBS repeat-containing protein [Planctomycetota bacterium]|nr:MAG: VCBS repeat-containing protein [Planctomycetota bacterium]REJ91854.1 MAG: VCBS repeat-containing protein [Planctomycetota bacterium]REK24579.1 MAG: VCBS repeat-containing protein [Planctomycetota bacterium]REK40799.1 MAG: VCBS repeat-containing protein [Planctomycetota bacterium]
MNQRTLGYMSRLAEKRDRRARATVGVRRLVRWLLLVVPVVVSLVSGCQREDGAAENSVRGQGVAGQGEGAARQQSPSDAAPAVDASPVVAAEDEERLVDEMLLPGHAERDFARLYADEKQRAAPERDGWDSEVFQDAATAQLKKLAYQMAATSSSAARLADIADPSFRTSPLRPPLVEVYRDQVLVVQRGATDSATNQKRADVAEPDVAGGDALHAAIENLVAPLRGGRAVRAKLKVVGVGLDQERAEARVLYQASAVHDTRRVQQRATWLCTWTRPDSAEPRLQSIRVGDFEEVATQTGGAPLLADCTEAVFANVPAYREQLAHGVDHWRARQERVVAPYISGLKGLAVGDVNGDGRDDLYICQGTGLPNRLLVQEADGTLRDISAAAGVDWRDTTNAALLVDLDNDGDQDLLVGTALAVLVHRNDGGERFALVAELPVTTLVTGMAAADYDGDRLVDIYVLGRTGEDDDSSSVLGVPIPYHDANNGGRNVLFRNRGELSFADVTESVGLEQNNRRFSWAAAWEDYDNDGDLDLYVANDFGRNNLYRYDATAQQFRDVAAEAGVEDIASGMSVAWTDYNDDGLMDLYVSNMFSGAGNRITYQRKFRPDADAETIGQIRRMARGNSLFENIGDGRFRDVSVESGLTMGRWAWGSKFVDLNNSGREDLVIANGFVTQPSADDL